MPTDAHVPTTAPFAPFAETRPQARGTVRRVTYGGLAGALPAGAAVGVGALTGSRRGGIAAGAAALAAMLVARWQLQRWFTAEPRHVVERTAGDLEIRWYAPRVEARIEIAGIGFDDALVVGYERLAHYIHGHNARNEKLDMAVPVTVVRRGTHFLVSFVMPPDHRLSSLPRPRDMRIALVAVPAQRIASLCFRGRYTGDHVARQEAEMVRHVLEGGLDTAGEPIFAGYDPPTTIGLLRRNEIWMQLG